MGLVKSHGNMYPWITDMHTHLGGACPHQCRYCYVQAMARKLPNMKRRSTGKPYLVPREFDVAYDTGKNIFIGHLTDLFASDIPDQWIEAILRHCRKYPGNVYTFQSKNPKRFVDFASQYPVDSWFGTTIETNRTDIIRRISKAPAPIDRVIGLIMIKNAFDIGPKTFITIEPILDFDLDQLVDLIKTARPDFVNIGADSKKHRLPEPPAEKVAELIEALKKECPEVKIKENLDRLIK